jgi:N-acetylmuramoyl-L-alanine amidase
MRPSYLGWLLTPLLLLGSPSLAAPDARLGALVLTSGRSGTELTLELPARATHHLFTLDHPDRVVVDLTGVTLTPGARPPAPAGLVRGLRIAQRSPSVLRIVLEIATPTSPHASRFSLGASRERLVVLLPGATPGETPAAVRELAAAPTRLVTIAVDAGHGGEDPGAIGRHGTREKDVTLAVARALAERIDAEPGMRAVLTRSGDYFVELRDRTSKAERAQADLFVSVHADAVDDRSVSGASVYVLSAHGASSEQARRLAEHENAADQFGGVLPKVKDPVLRSVVLDVAQSEAMSSSRLVARRILGSLDEIGDVHRSEVQQAGFMVLKSPYIPSLLIETAYITNPDDERELRNPAHQGRLADAILAGLRAYFRDHPPTGTRLVARSDASSGRTAPLR